MKEINEYKTTDMDFITILYYFGKKIKRINQINFKQKEFIFIDDGTIEKLRMDYINHKLKCEPMKLWNCISAVKSMIHSVL